MNQDTSAKEHTLAWIVGNAVARFGTPGSSKKTSDGLLLIQGWSFQSGSVTLQQKLDPKRGTEAKPFIRGPFEMEVKQELYNQYGGYEVTEVTTYFGQQSAGAPLRAMRQNFIVKGDVAKKTDRVFNLLCNRDQMIVDAGGRPIGDSVFWDNSFSMLTARNPVLDREKQIYMVENRITAP